MAEPLAITREEAASLCRLSPTGFDSWVRRGIVPGPIKGTKRWSRAALERAISGDIVRLEARLPDHDPEEIARRWFDEHDADALQGH